MTIEFQNGNSKEYEDLFDHLRNGNGQSKEVLLGNYTYDTDNYESILRDFSIEATRRLLSQSVEHYIFSFSSVLPNTKFNEKNSNLSNLFNGADEKNFSSIKFDDSIVQVAKYPILYKESMQKAIQKMFSGYAGPTFIASGNTVNAIDQLQFHREYNRHRIVVGNSLDISQLKSLFESVYFTYGGFDYGQFVMIKF